MKRFTDALGSKLEQQEYRTKKKKKKSFILLPVTLSLSVPNISLGAQFSDTLNLCSLSFSVRKL
jgi:hypothetical protein